MFTVTAKGTNRIDIEFSGKLDSEEMKSALDELAGKCQDIENGRMLYRVGDFRLPRLGYRRAGEEFRAWRKQKGEGMSTEVKLMEVGPN